MRMPQNDKFLSEPKTMTLDIFLKVIASDSIFFCILLRNHLEGTQCSSMRRFSPRTIMRKLDCRADRQLEVFTL